MVMLWMLALWLSLRLCWFPLRFQKGCFEDWFQGDSREKVEAGLGDLPWEGNRHGVVMISKLVFAGDSGFPLFPRKVCSYRLANLPCARFSSHRL